MVASIQGVIDRGNRQELMAAFEALQGRAFDAKQMAINGGEWSDWTEQDEA